jgi:hypothetical protein
MGRFDKTSNDSNRWRGALSQYLQAWLRMVWLFDRSKEREKIAHDGIGEMLPEKPAKARTFERAHALKAQPIPESVDPHDLRIRNQHRLRKLKDQGQSLSHSEPDFAFESASGVREIEQEGLADPAGFMARRKLQASGHGDAIGLSVVCS